MLSQAHAALQQRSEAIRCCQLAVEVCRELGREDREAMAMAMLASLSEDPAAAPHEDMDTKDG